MKSKISGLDWLKLGAVWLVFVFAFLFIDSIWIALLWAYVFGVILFRIDNRPAGYSALIILTLTPIALFLQLNELAEIFAVNVYYLLCIMVFSEIWSSHKLSWPWLENTLDRGTSWFIGAISKISDWVWIILLICSTLILISEDYFFISKIPYNSFLDLGLGAVHTDVIRQFSIGWFYQFGKVWNILASNWSVLYTEFLGWIAGDFYLGIKIHQFLSIVIGAWGVIVLWRSLMVKLEDRVASISSQVLVALIYVFNPFYLSVLNGVVEFGVAYSLMPWIVWSWLRLIRDKEGKWWELGLQVIVTGVLLSFATVVSGITLVFTNALPLFVIMFGIGLISFESKIELLRRGILLSLVWLIVALMGLHVIIPTFFGYRQADGILDSTQTEERESPFVKDFYSPTLEEIMYLQNKEGIVSEEIGYNFRAIPLKYRLVWFFWSSLGIISIIWFRKNKYIIPIWLATGLSGYLALGYSKSWLYRLLNEYFPYFWGLRTPGRFMMVFALGVAVLGGLVWYYIFKSARLRAWRLGAVSVFGLVLVLVIISARHQEFEMKTFNSIPDMDYHFQGLEKAKQTLDELNPNMEYRILDLTRDDDGSWNHTRVMSVNQRYLNDFEKILIQYPATDWGSVLQNHNVKYIVISTYDDYCKDRFSDNIYNNRNLISCYLLQYKNKLKLIDADIPNYKIYEVKDVKPYVYGDGIAEKFSYAPIVKTGDEKQKVRVAEIYSPQFRWTCNGDKVVESSPERDGLVQAAILPANSECKFGYYKAWSVRVADWIFYGLFGIAVGTGLWSLGRVFVKRR
jgi:hypothetical protein